MAKRSDGSRCHLTWRYYVLGRPRLRPHIVLDGYTAPPTPPPKTRLDGDPSPKEGHNSPPLCGQYLFWQTAGWFKMPHCVIWGASSPSKKGAAATIFLARPMSIVVKRLDGSICHCPGDIVLDGNPAFPKKGHSAPIFGPYVCCGETAGWMSVPLDTEVGLGLGDIMRWGPSPPPPKKVHSPNFRLCLLWPNGWMYHCQCHFVRIPSAQATLC